MEDGISVGIIIPVYKIPGELLKTCYASLHNQEYKNIKILFVDDASPDDCGKMCDEFAAEDDRVRVIHKKENDGVSAARNKGIESIDTDYVTFVDGDDWIDHNVISDVISWADDEKEDYDVIMFRQMVNYGDTFEEDDYISEKYWKTEEERNELQMSAISSAIKGVADRAMSVDNVAGKLIKKRVLDENVIRFKGIPYREDGVFFQELVECSKSIAVVPYGFYHYRMREGSAVNSFRPNGPEELLNLCKCMWEFAANNNKSALYYRRLYSFLLIPIQMVVSTYYYHPSCKLTRIERHCECRKYLKQKPYSDMKKHIKIGELKRNSKIKYILIRLKFYWLVYKLRECINRRGNKRLNS